jgi:hypothetical protein
MGDRIWRIVFLLSIVFSWSKSRILEENYHVRFAGELAAFCTAGAGPRFFQWENLDKVLHWP